MADDLADVDVDDKKPVVFDDVREQEPDPDEELNMAGVSQDVWLVKMPKFLLQRWSSVTAGGIPLGTIRVYEERDKATGMQRVEILLPEHFNQAAGESPSAAPSPPSGSASQSSNQMMSSEEHQAALSRAEAALEEHERSATRFDLEILRPGKYELAENQLVIGNRPKPKDDGTPSRARESFRKGKVKHTCAMQPYMDARYRKIIRDRAQLANMPKRRIIQVNAEDMNSTSEVNTLPSMAEVNASWQPRASKAPVKKGEFERYARMPKNELLDKLFGLFQEEKPYWPLKELRLRTQQPEGYLKEVVTSIAILHRNGEHVGKYSLKAEHLNASGMNPNFIKPEAGSSALADDMDDDDEDDDDEMEEVS